MAQPTKDAPTAPTQAGCLAEISRVFWLVIGNGILFFLAVYIPETRAMSALDIAFWAVMGALIRGALCRYNAAERAHEGRSASVHSTLVSLCRHAGGGFRGTLGHRAHARATDHGTVKNPTGRVLAVAGCYHC